MIDGKEALIMGDKNPNKAPKKAKKIEKKASAAEAPVKKPK
jgi:hypothetical protein